MPAEGWLNVVERLSRAEQRARTRAALTAAAERVFIRHGFHAASVEEVAEEAGFSKGAVYSNFESKDELFLSVLEARVDSRALSIEAAIDPTKPVTEQATDAGERFFEVFLREPEWSLLLIEYIAHAARHEELRERFAQRNRWMRAAAGSLIDKHLAALGLASPIPTEQLALILFALGDGLILQRLEDPNSVASETFGKALGLLFTGLVATNEASAQT
ncbi:MAG: TetR/AcrR family transcriptional regulator [Acidimicrobiales bacterium]